MRIEAAKAWLRQEALGKGALCPVCNRFTKIYKRQITSSMARFLITFWREHKDFDYHHVGRDYRKCGDYGKLAYWGLLESRRDSSDRKKDSGFWCITPEGYNFIHETILLKKYAHVYGSHVLSFSGPSITITDALRTGYSYKELMS